MAEYVWLREHCIIRHVIIIDSRSVFFFSACESLCACVHTCVSVCWGWWRRCRLVGAERGRGFLMKTINCENIPLEAVHLGLDLKRIWGWLDTSPVFLPLKAFLVDTRPIPHWVIHLSHYFLPLSLSPCSANHIYQQNTDSTSRFYFPRELHCLLAQSCIR